MMHIVAYELKRWIDWIRGRFSFDSKDRSEDKIMIETIFVKEDRPKGKYKKRLKTRSMKVRKTYRKRKLEGS